MIFMSSSSKQAVVIIRRIKASGRQELNLYYRLLYSLKTEQLCEQVISSGKHGIAWIGNHWAVRLGGCWEGGLPKAGRAKGGEGVGEQVLFAFAFRSLPAHLPYHTLHSESMCNL